MSVPMRRGLFWLQLLRASHPCGGVEVRDLARARVPRASDEPATVSIALPDKSAGSPAMRSGAIMPAPLDIEMMHRALGLARLAASRGEVPVGAVVYRPTGDAAAEVIGEGFNLRESRNDPAAHAEFLAIGQACQRLGDWRLEGCSLAVTLEPCPMCAGLIVNARLPRIVYGAADPKAGAVRSLFRLADDPRLNHRAQIIPGVLAQQCADELRTFFSSLRAERRAGSKQPPA